MDGARRDGSRRPGGACRPVVAGLLLAACLPLAADDIDHREARRLREAGAIRPLGEVLAALAARRPGRVLETELEREDGRYVYEIEILDPTGQVHEFEIDAATGEVLQAKIESGDD